MARQLTLMLGAATCAAVLAIGEISLAEAANEEDCRKFHQECSDARAQGYRDVGICNVERLECKSGPANAPDAGVGRRPRGAPGPRQDPESSIGP